jgi:hypothetical protein
MRNLYWFKVARAMSCRDVGAERTRAPVKLIAGSTCVSKEGAAFQVYRIALTEAGERMLTTNLARGIPTLARSSACHYRGSTPDWAEEGRCLPGLFSKIVSRVLRRLSRARTPRG